MAKLLFTALLFFVLSASHLSAQDVREKTILIGKQVWMTENLNSVRFQNGDQILQAQSDEEWIQAGKNKQPAWCIDNVPSSGGQNDLLYNWYAVSDQRNICPAGYHVATDSDWTTLSGFLGGEAIAGEKLKSKTGWPNKGNGTNETGFSATPGTVRIKDGIFSPQNSSAAWWSSTTYDKTYAYYRSLYFSTNQVTRSTFNKTYGCHVRCVKN